MKWDEMNMMRLVHAYLSHTFKWIIRLIFQAFMHQTVTCTITGCYIHGACELQCVLVTGLMASRWDATGLGLASGARIYNINIKHANIIIRNNIRIWRNMQIFMIVIIIIKHL